MTKRIKQVDIVIVVTILFLLGLIILLRNWSSVNESALNADTNGDGQVTLADYQGKELGSITGIDFDALVEKYMPGAKIEYYNNYSDLVVALQSNMIDAFIIDGAALVPIILENPFVGELPEHLDTWSMSFAFSEKSNIPGLKDKMNAFLKMAEENGVLDEIRGIWFGQEEDLKVIPPLESLSKENGTIKVALENTYAPIVYVKDQKIVGLEIDILYRYCEYYHYGLELLNMQFDAILPAVITGKCDVGCSGIQYNEEHAAAIEMSLPHQEAYISLAVPASVLSGEEEEGADKAEKKTLVSKLSQSLYKNLIKEDRWKMIVQGLFTTIGITVLSALFGTLIAFGICLLRRTNSTFANPLCDLYVTLMRGIPIVVVLMILYYIIFSGTDINPFWVAIIGFTLNFGAYASVIMQSGLDSIDPGQEEAALALGYTRNQAFLIFLYPQAAIHFLPVYRSELVTLLKETSVVGYIAVQDLTKMGDIIRSRSYDAFFPLVTMILIYFLLAYVISIVVNMLLKIIQPGKKNTLQGGEKA